MRTYSFDRPDNRKLQRSNIKHPKGQCRVDTYFQAALCNISHNENVDMNLYDLDQGQCSRYYRHTDLGARPECWYKPSGAPITH
jgi:hypothetical protein